MSRLGDAFRALRGLGPALLAVKASSARIIEVQFPGQPVGTLANVRGYTEEGFKKNVVVFRCVSDVAQAVASVPLYIVDQDENEVDSSTNPAAKALLKLLCRPNYWQPGKRLIEALVAYRKLTGNAYLQAVGPEGGLPLELWALRPDRMKVIPGPLGYPAGYRYTVGQRSRDLGSTDPITGAPGEVLHIRSFNPTDDWYGLSDLAAAALQVEQHNLGSLSNRNLLAKGGRPGGFLRPLPDPSGSRPAFTEEQRRQLAAEIEERVKGAENTGGTLILDNFEWVNVAISPRDLDWLNGMHASARWIAQAMGVPPMLLGIPGDNTYSNMSEARASFWEDTVLPECDETIEELNWWLTPRFGEGWELRADLDSVPALAARREAAWGRIRGVDFLTINEKRETLGYPPLDQGGDQVLVPIGVVPLDALSEEAAPGDATEPGEGQEPGEPPAPNAAASDQQPTPPQIPPAKRNGDARGSA